MTLIRNGLGRFLDIPRCAEGLPVDFLPILQLQIIEKNPPLVSQEEAIEVFLLQAAAEVPQEVIFSCSRLQRATVVRW